MRGGRLSQAVVLHWWSILSSVPTVPQSMGASGALAGDEGQGLAHGLEALRPSQWHPPPPASASFHSPALQDPSDGSAAVTQPPSRAASQPQGAGPLSVPGLGQLRPNRAAGNLHAPGTPRGQSADAPSGRLRSCGVQACVHSVRSSPGPPPGGSLLALGRRSHDDGAGPSPRLDTAKSMAPRVVFTSPCRRGWCVAAGPSGSSSPPTVKQQGACGLATASG